MFSRNAVKFPVTPVRRPLNWPVSPTSRSARTDEAARDVVPCEFRTWFGQSVVFPAGYVDGRAIVVVETTGGDLFPALSATVRQASAVLSFACFDAAVQVARRNKCSEYIFVVDIDTFRYIGAAFQQLQRFREAHPRIPVVMASRYFQRNDFSSRRHIVADASVQSQGGSIAVALAIASAIENHRSVQSNMPRVFRNPSAVSFRHTPNTSRPTA